jgi:hypothetical protein
VQSSNELKTRIAGSIATSLYPSPSFEIGECSLPPDASKKLAVIRVRETSEMCLITKKNVTPNPIYIRNEDRSDPADAGQIRALLQRKAALQNASTGQGLRAYYGINEFWITRMVDGQAQRSDTELRITIEPTSAAMDRLDMMIENQFRKIVLHNFRGIEYQPNFHTTPDRGREWFEINVVSRDDYQMRWRITSAGDVAFITQICNLSLKRWSLYDVIAHTIYALRTARDFWMSVGFFGSGKTSIELRIPGIELKCDGGFPADWYDPDRTGVERCLTSELLVLAEKPRSFSSAYFPVDHMALTDTFDTTSTELLHQLLRGLGHGVRFETLLKVVQLF